MKWCKKVGKQRIELFNLKNKEGQEKFRIMTTETNELTEAFNNDEDIKNAQIQHEMYLSKYRNRINKNLIAKDKIFCGLLKGKIYN